MTNMLKGILHIFRFCWALHTYWKQKNEGKHGQGLADKVDNRFTEL